MERALRIRATALGEDHPKTDAISRLLADTLRKAGDEAKAAAVERQLAQQAAKDEAAPPPGRPASADAQ